MKKFATLVAVAVCFLVGGNPLRADDAKQDGKFYLDTATGTVSQRLDAVERRLDTIEKKLDAVLAANKAGSAPATVGGPIVNPNWQPAQPTVQKTKTIQVCRNGRCEFIEVPDDSISTTFGGVNSSTCPCDMSYGPQATGYCGAAGCPAVNMIRSSTVGGFQTQPVVTTFAAPQQIQYRTGLFGRPRPVRGTTCGPNGCQ